MLRVLRPITKKFFIASCCGSLLFACSESTLPEVQALTGLRVLGIQASLGGRAEFAAGESGITLTPVVSDVTETSGLTFQAYGCKDPGVNFGADPNCDSASDRVDLGSGSTGLTTATQFTGAATSLTVTIPSDILAQATPIARANGVSYLIDYRLSNSRGQTAKAFKRLLVSERVTKNNNPELTDLFSGGSSLSSLIRGNTLTVSPQAGAVWSESYTVLNTSGEVVNRDEELLVTWMTNQSEWKFSRTVMADSNEIFIDQDVPLADGRKWVLVVVVRDGRGGLDYVVKTF